MQLPRAFVRRALPLAASALGLVASMPQAAAATQASDRAALIVFVDSATALMERWSVKGPQIDWPSLRAAARAMVDTASKPDTSVANAAVRDALAKLGDHHSFLLDSAQVHGMDDPSPDGSTPYNIRLISGHVGYASIAAYTAQDSATMQRYAIDFQARLRRIAKQASCGWIVDLRGNTGGNMWPMLAGIGPLLGNGAAGRFVSRDSAIAWGYTDGSAWEGVDTIVKVPNPLVLPFRSVPVAVLTDSMTASSGESIAISFRERPRTRSFGTPTYGLTTGNEGYDLPGGSMLFLTTVIEADRSGTLFGGQLIPDSLTAAEDALPAAESWLRSASCPGSS